MRPPDIHSLFLAMRDHRAVFLYSGAFQDDHTARLIQLGEAAMEDGVSRPAGRGRLAFIMVEAYQNILRHRVPLPPAMERGRGRSLFLLLSRHEEHQVVAFNPVAKSGVPALREHLEGLRGLDGDALKRKSLSVLQREHDGKRKGAGLGLIEMARRSGSDLSYEISDLDGTHAMFILSVRMGTVPGGDNPFTVAHALHQAVEEKDLLIMHTGERPPSVQEALLRMVEEDVVDHPDRSSTCGRAFLAAAGCLDRRSGKVSRHFFALVRTSEHYYMSMGCLMDPAVATDLGTRIQHLVALDRAELDRRYRGSLIQRGLTGDDTDLLDLVRISLEPLRFAHFPVPGSSQVFCLVQAVI